MTLCEMGSQYEQSARLLKTRIDHLSEKIKQTNPCDACEMKMRLSILTNEYYTAMQTAKFLKAYYSKTT